MDSKVRPNHLEGCNSPRVHRMQKLISAWNGHKIDIEDAREYLQENNPGFSPERNKAVIAKTIADAHKRRAEFLKSQENELKERTQATADYIKFIATHDEISNTPERYFGKKYLAYLRGQHLLQTLFQSKTGQKGVISQWSDTIIE